MSLWVAHWFSVSSFLQPHGIPQARIVELVAISYSRGYSWRVLYNLWPWVWKGAWVCCRPLLTAAAVTECTGDWEGPPGSTVGLTDLAASCLQSECAFSQRAPCKGLPLVTIARTQGSCCLALCPSHFGYLPAGYFRPKKESEVSQSCLTLCNPMDCSLPGSSIHGILQARILEWVAIPFSRRFYRPRDWTQVSLMAGRLQSEPPGNPTSVLNPFLNTHLWLFFISISFFYKSLVWNICNSVLFSFYPDLCCSDLF